MARREAEEALSRARKDVTRMLDETKVQTAEEKAQLDLRRDEIAQEREAIETWRTELAGWRAQLDKERATLDASKSLVEQDRVEVKKEIARTEARWAELERKGAQLLEGAQQESDAIIERAWSEARRVMGHADESDEADRLAELRAELEKQRGDFEKSRAEFEQNQAQLEIDRAELAAERDAFAAQVAAHSETDGATISEALTELEEELRKLDASAPESTQLKPADPAPSTDDAASSLGNWNMLWSDDEGPDGETEVIEELAETAEESTAEPETESSSESDEEDPEDESFGESRYARKSRHLPHLEDGADTQSGSGLRDAIIGVTKRGGSS